MSPSGRVDYTWALITSNDNVFTLPLSRVILADRRVLASHRQIIAAAESAAESPLVGDTLRAIDLSYPGPPSAKLRIPLTRQTLDLALAWSRRGIVDIQYDAIRILQSAPPSESIPILQRMIDEEANPFLAATHNGFVAYHAVRRAAYSALEHLQPADVAASFHVPVALVPLVLFFAFLLRRPHPDNLRSRVSYIRISLLTTAIVVNLAIVFLWIRSHSDADELLFTVADTTYQLASYRGGFQIISCEAWYPRERPFLWTPYDLAPIQPFSDGWVSAFDLTIRSWGFALGNLRVKELEHHIIRIPYLALCIPMVAFVLLQLVRLTSRALQTIPGALPHVRLRPSRHPAPMPRMRNTKRNLITSARRPRKPNALPARPPTIENDSIFRQQSSRFAVCKVERMRGGNHILSFIPPRSLKTEYPPRLSFSGWRLVTGDWRPNSAHSPPFPARVTDCY